MHRFIRFIFLCFFLGFVFYVPQFWQNLKGPGYRQLSHKLSLVSHTQKFKGLDRLAQPFFYWGKGSQFYVYLGQDGKTVLKIPRASKLRESFFGQILHKSFKKPDLFRSMQIANDFLNAETALIMVHYGQIRGSLPCILCYDRLHRSFRLDLNQTPFILQQRCDLLSSSLIKFPQDRKCILSSYLDLIENEKNKGWKCRDRAFWLNVAYAEQKAYRIDIGSYVPINESFSLTKMVKPVIRWLKKNDPDLCIWFQNEIIRRNG